MSASPRWPRHLALLLLAAAFRVGAAEPVPVDTPGARRTTLDDLQGSWRMVESKIRGDGPDVQQPFATCTLEFEGRLVASTCTFRGRTSRSVSRIDCEHLDGFCETTLIENWDPATVGNKSHVRHRIEGDRLRIEVKLPWAPGWSQPMPDRWIDSIYVRP